VLDVSSLGLLTSWHAARNSLHVSLFEQRIVSMGCKRAPGHTATIIDEVKTWRCQAPPRHVSVDPPSAPGAVEKPAKSCLPRPSQSLEVERGLQLGHVEKVICAVFRTAQFR
jgi:hypothetical protein